MANNKCALVTGAAGFVGSSMVDRLLAEGYSVVGLDNHVTGQRQFLSQARENDAFRLVEGDLLDGEILKKAMDGCGIVFHFAANADVRFGLNHPRRDLEQNTIATFHVLEAMRACGATKIIFSSTGSVYGEAKQIPTPEDAAFPIQTSLYAASKLAGEGMIQAYCEGYKFEGYIFRFVSLLGERYSHGHVFDFYKQLHEHPDYLRVLGDGRQRKSYLYIHDCLDAILHVVALGSALESKHRVEVYNLGTSEHCEVRDSIGWITQALGLQPRLDFAGGDRGWVGDNPFILLDNSKVCATGWKPKLSIREGIERTVAWLKRNEWIFQSRKP